MVQRVLGTNQVDVAQRGCVLAGWLKLLPMLLMVLPGLVAKALFPNEVARDSNLAYPLLVQKVLPQGLVGLMVAVMLSSFMAALSSCFNSCSALFTMDVYRPAMAERGMPASEQQLVFVGRFFTIVMGILS